jgi:predicted nucleic acid-binding Zn ribbon protein
VTGSGRQCSFCGSAIYGRSDKRYCSATCRRDASRVRKRVIRIGDYEYFGSERAQSDSVIDYVIPRLEREYGPNHRSVADARRLARELREADYDRLVEKIKAL